MHAVRRLYTYFIVAVSLAVLSVGVANLIRLALEQAWPAGGASLAPADSEALRRQLSLYVALVVVALPIWAVHWWLAQRARGRPGAAGEEERCSPLRSLYLTLGLAAPLAVAIPAAIELIGHVARALAGASRGGQPAGWIAALLVAGAVWGYHAWLRERDLAAGPLPPESLILPRLYRYAATFVGMLLLLFGARSLIGLAVDAAAGGPVLSEVRWWAVPLAEGVAVAAVGLVLWGSHWSYSQRVLATSGWRGESERRSTERLLYLYGSLVVAAVVTLLGAAGSLEALLRELLGAPLLGSLRPGAWRIVEPLLLAVPFALFWLYQRRQVLGEPERALLRRLYTYGAALVGLGFAAVGLGWVLGILIDLLLGGARTVAERSDLWRGELARFAGVAVVGSALWLAEWYVAQRRVAADLAAERGATTRRVYLYAVVAGALVATLGSLAVVVYRLLRVLLGVASSQGLASDVSAALGVLVVAAALLAYHGVTLRGDLAARPPAGGPSAARLALVLSGPPGADLEAALAELRAHLPVGYDLSVARAAPRRVEPEVMPPPAEASTRPAPP